MDEPIVLYCSTNFPRAQVLLRERLAGSGLAIRFVPDVILRPGSVIALRKWGPYPQRTPTS